MNRIISLSLLFVALLGFNIQPQKNIFNGDPNELHGSLEGRVGEVLLKQIPTLRQEEDDNWCVFYTIINLR